MILKKINKNFIKMAKALRICYSILVLYDGKSSLLQNDFTGEILQHWFFSWRDAVHYSLWKSLSENEHKSFEDWSKKYGYKENEEFNGDLNEFSNKSYKWEIYVSGNIITHTHNLETIYSLGLPKETDDDEVSRSSR